MKRVVSSFLMIILLPILFGCNRSPAAFSTAETQVPYSFDYDRLWTFDPGQSDYKQSGAAQWITWNSKASLHWNRVPLEFAAGGSVNAEKRVENGVTYYLKENEAAWDGTDANQKWISGLFITRQVDYEQDGYRYLLTASASQKGISLETASISTLLALAEHPGLVLSDFEKTMEGWSTSFQNGSLSLSITISPPPFDQQEIDRYLAEGGSVLTSTEDGLQYISSGRDRSAGDPMSAFLFAKTEIGTVSIRGGVPYLERDTVPADSLDYIDIDMVRAIVAWVKGG